MMERYDADAEIGNAYADLRRRIDEEREERHELAARLDEIRDELTEMIGSVGRELEERTGPLT